MNDKFKWGPANPHPLSRRKTELVWEGKYDEFGNRREVDVSGLALPMQRIETVDDPLSRAEADGNLELFQRERKKSDDFRNRLIWGDNKLVMASLLKEFKGKIDLIYIDPPFDVGADFTMDVPIGDGKETVEKDQSTLEMVAYRDMWGKGTDSYLHMMFERLTLMKELLSERGSIYVHCDWHMSQWLRALLDEVFGKENFQNELYWYYYNKLHGATKKVFPRATDTILYYLKNRSAPFTFQHISEPRDKPVKKLKYSFIGGRIVNDKDEGGKTVTYLSTERQRIARGLPRVASIAGPFASTTDLRSMNTTGELLTIRAEALEPLFAAWEEPSRHRVRVENANGGFAQARPGRRPSSLTIAQNLRGVVREWRENFYPGASDTSRQLLNHWFGRAHRVGTGDAGFEFRYYFCQREAIETLIYLKEVRRVERLSQLTAEFGGANAEIAGLGITEEEDAWSRYCFKMATGSGKTKAMSLAIVWSYFHSLRESDSTMARHFVVIAPNLTVFERLREDLKPEGGGLDIFDRDPLIPVEWRGDWNLSVILQDEAAGAATGGTLYLTNIHRLFDKSTKRRNQAETYDWMGPTVSKAKALDTGAELRDRITSHSRVMVINDEAHHVWDPDSAWNEAIRYLHDTIQRRTGGELAAQLDFTATPKDNAGNYFKHIVCDTPLGEAVDAGIVKTPLIGRAGNLTEQASDDAAYRYEAHLRLGYQRWVMSRDEWIKSGKKPLLFVMCEDTSAADQITARLNCDEVFKELNGRTINLHTNLKGKIKKVGKQAVFVESEKDISDEDLKALRRLSRELDSDSSPYFCIVSVLMLREGWDVRNVTTIVPLRPYSSKAGILPEQTLGRGLRRMTPSGQANEIVAVVEHEAFARLYREELAQEGLALEIMEVGEVPVTTVSIFPDVRNKDVPALDIFLPRLSPATQTLPVLGAIAEAELKEAFASFKPVPLGAKGTEELKYEGRHLITGEVVEHMKVNLPLLESGVGAISYYERELEYICKVKNTHAVLGPLLQKFFEDMLFSEPCSLFDARLAARIADSDVREHVRAVFVPLVRKKILKTQIRQLAPAPIPLSGWRPFQVTVSDQRPALRSPRTLFNLVPCNRALEVALTELCGRTPDVAAFAKNSGPQCLRIDYLAGESRLAYYAPDFIVRSTSRLHYLVETKGRVDKDVPAKARAAVQWCKSASKPNSKWQYVYLPEGVFQRFHGDRFEELARASAPALHDLINAERYRDELPLFADQVPAEELAHASSTFVSAEILEALPPRMRRAVDEAINLFQFLEKKPGANLAPVFTALLGVLDEAIKTLIRQRLEPKIPKISSEQSAWFEPYLGDVDHKQHRHYNEMARNLKKTLIFKNGISPLGLLRNCLEHAFNDPNRIRGIFESIRGVFDFEGAQSLYAKVGAINEFRNNRVAHQERPLNDPKEAKQALVTWVEGLNLMAAISKAPSVPRE